MDSLWSLPTDRTTQCTRVAKSGRFKWTITCRDRVNVNVMLENRIVMNNIYWLVATITAFSIGLFVGWQCCFLFGPEINPNTTPDSLSEFSSDTELMDRVLRGEIRFPTDETDSTGFAAFVSRVEDSTITLNIGADDGLRKGTYSLSAPGLDEHFAVTVVELSHNYCTCTSSANKERLKLLIDTKVHLNFNFP